LARLFLLFLFFELPDTIQTGIKVVLAEFIKNMFEVDFASLAFGFMGLLAVFLEWGDKAQALVILGYAVYLFQAALLHGYRYCTHEAIKDSPLFVIKVASFVPKMV